VLLVDATERHPRRDGLLLRARVWRHRASLDRSLAEGADPATDPAVALRARQLRDPASRRAMANTLENLVHAAEEPPDAWPHGGPRPPLRREALLAARSDLIALAELLRRPRALPPGALALVALLLWDSASPVYSAHAGTTVSEWVHAAADGARPAGFEPATSASGGQRSIH
jgi:hypothetical protein